MTWIMDGDVVEGPGKQVHVLWFPKQFHSKRDIYNNDKLSLSGVLASCFRPLPVFSKNVEYFLPTRNILPKCAVHICASAFAFFTIDTMKAGTSNAHG